MRRLCKLSGKPRRRDLKQIRRIREDLEVHLEEDHIRVCVLRKKNGEVEKAPLEISTEDLNRIAVDANCSTWIT